MTKLKTVLKAVASSSAIQKEAVLLVRLVALTIAAKYGLHL